MKNFVKVWGIIALVAVIGFSMAACGGDDDDGGPDLNGVWKGKTNGTVEVEVVVTVGEDGITIETEGAKDEGKLGEPEETKTGFSYEITVGEDVIGHIGIWTLPQ